jgi:hypothetical protein
VASAALALLDRQVHADVKMKTMLCAGSRAHMSMKSSKFRRNLAERIGIITGPAAADD